MTSATCAFLSQMEQQSSSNVSTRLACDEERSVWNAYAVCSHDPANVQQTSSKCIRNTRRANAGRLLEVCRIA